MEILPLGPLGSNLPAVGSPAGADTGMFAVTLASGALPAASMQSARMPTLAATPPAIPSAMPCGIMPPAGPFQGSGKPGSMSLLLAGAATTAPAMPALPGLAVGPGPIPTANALASPPQQTEATAKSLPAAAEATGAKTEGEDLPLAGAALPAMLVNADPPLPKTSVVVDITGRPDPMPEPGMAAAEVPAASETGPGAHTADFAPSPPAPDETAPALGEPVPIGEAKPAIAAPQQTQPATAPIHSSGSVPLDAVAGGLVSAIPSPKRGSAIADGGNRAPDAVAADPDVPGAPSGQAPAGRLDSARAAPAVQGNGATPFNEGQEDGGPTVASSETYEPVDDVPSTNGADLATKTDKPSAQPQLAEAAIRTAPSAAADRSISPAVLQPAAPAPAAASSAPASSLPIADLAFESMSAESQPVLEARAGQLGRDMGVEIARRISAGLEELVIRLDPAELGRISIRMSLNDQGSLRAVLAAEAPAALDVLRHEIGDLGRALEQAGVRTDADSLRFDRGSGGESGSAWQRYQSQERNLRPGGGAAAEHAAEPEQLNVRTSGRVNLMA